MAVMAVLGGLCAVAVVVLAVVVVRLSLQVRRLSTDLAAVVDRPAVVAVDASATALAQQPASLSRHETRLRQPSPSETAPPAPTPSVPVITGLPDHDGPDDLDLTARRVASVTLARPLVKVASLSYGLRRALDDEHRFKVRYAIRQELRRQRKLRRRRKSGRAPSMGWRA
jgi:hypothetical protein